MGYIYIKQASMGTVCSEFNGYTSKFKLGSETFTLGTGGGVALPLDNDLK